MLVITEEPVRDTYRRLIEHAVSRCHEFCLVVRPDMGLSKEGLHVLAELASARTRVEEASAWPGTVLLGATATVYWHRCTPAVVPVLTGRCTSLYGWRQPERPEDLCFILPDGTPWLTSTAHERDAYFEASVDVQQVLQAAPTLLVEQQEEEPS